MDEQICNKYLRHVQSWLSDGELEDAAGSVRVSQDRLQLGELDPGGAVLRAELQVFLVQLPAAVELTQLQLQLDVALQQFVLRAFTDGCTLRGETMAIADQAEFICRKFPVSGF